MSKRSFEEIGETKSSAQYDAYKELLKKLIQNGYTVVDEHIHEDRGLDQELLATTTETFLDPPLSSLPMIRCEAKEIQGTYDFEKNIFTPLPVPKFELHTYKKGSEIHERNEPWDKIDLG